MGYSYSEMEFIWDGVRHTCHDCEFKNIKLPNEPCGECFKTLSAMPFPCRVAKSYLPAHPEQHETMKSMLNKYRGYIQKMVDDLRQNGISKGEFEFQFRKTGMIGGAIE